MNTSKSYRCNSISRQKFKSGAEGIVFEFKDDLNNSIRKYDIFKNKDGSTKGAQIDSIQRDIDIVDPAQKIDLKKVFDGNVIYPVDNFKFELKLNTEGFVEKILRK